MQGKHLYEYAVIRLVPKVEREEFLNEDKLKLYVSEVDRELVFAHLDVFNKICSGAKDGGPIAQLDVPERFRWLTAVRSSCIQTSRPHAGFSDDLDRTLERLFKELVL